MENMINYPRPMIRRKEWINLNGVWEFAFDDEEIGEMEKWFLKFPHKTRIVVPFTYETKKSGINDDTPHKCIWYNKKIKFDKIESGKRLLINFEGSDYETNVWINGNFIGNHRGGYTRFTFDITNYIVSDINTITVEVKDDFDTEKPRGKQRWKDKSYACWYIQTTGIWKTVWLESVSRYYIKNISITPNIMDKSVFLKFKINQFKEKDLMLHIYVSFKGKRVTYTDIQVKDVRPEVIINITDYEVSEWGIAEWSTQNPNIYDLCVELKNSRNEVIDRITSYFGMREIRIKNGNILLNGIPLYQRLILNQGYWEESHLTPPSEEDIINDVNKIVALGYNGVRNHQKVEDERFLYWCDMKGLLVWGEFPSHYEFGIDAVENVTKQWIDNVIQNYNHPSIIIWTPINESWGLFNIERNKSQQQFSEAIYNITKAIDPMRPVIVNDGWEHTVSDIITLHDYEEDSQRFMKRYTECKDEILVDKIYPCATKSAFANGYSYKGQPIIISEYGGIAFNSKESYGWGYGKSINDEKEFLLRFSNMTEAIKQIPYICGYCYTQFSDVQQEINGLTDSRHEFKISSNKIKIINEEIPGYWHAKNYYDNKSCFHL